MQVVTKVTATPGHAQSPAGTTTIGYEGGLFDAVEREFRGFRKVTEARPDGRITTTAFHQDVARAGQVESVEVTSLVSGQTKMWLRRELFYTPDAGAPFVSLVCKARTLEYDQQAAPRVSATLYEYDQQLAAAAPDASPCGGITPTVGNLTAAIEYGEVNGATDVVPGDTRRSELAYWVPADPANATPYLVDRVGIARLRSGPSSGDPVVRESHFFYDGSEGTGTLPPPLTGALPTKGNLTARRRLAFDALAVDPVTRFEYDAFGNVTAVKSPRWNAAEAGGWSTFEYDNVFHTFPLATTNGQGQRTEFGWISTEECQLGTPLGSGLVAQIRDPNALDAGDSGELRCYDAFGRIERVRAPGGLAASEWTYNDTPGSASVLEQRRTSAPGVLEETRDRTTYVDGFGRAVRSEEDGPSSRRVDTFVFYDTTGRLSQQTGPQFYDAPVNQATEWRYDVLDRITRVCLPGTGSTNCTYGTGRVHTAGFNQGTVTATDANGVVTQTTVDPLGRVVTVREGLGSGPLTTYAHDVADQLTGIVDSATNQTVVGYDGLGRRTLLDDPDTGVSTYEYDPHGNLRFAYLPSSDPESPTVVEWRYESLDRPISRTINGAGAETWDYDWATNGIGLPYSHESGSFCHTIVAFDLLGRPTSERMYTSSSVPAHHFSTSYNSLGQVSSRTYPTTDGVLWTYDSNGYLTGIGTTAGEEYAKGIKWEARGRLEEWTAGNGVRSVRTFDNATARLGTLAIRTPAGSDIHNVSYGFDNADLLTQIYSWHWTLSHTYGYVRNRLTSASGPFGPSRGFTTLYNSYDDLGNLTCREATWSSSDCPEGTKLQYPPAGSLRPHTPTTVDNQPVSYDEVGNISSVVAGGVNQSFTYTPIGELSTASVGGVTKASFAYDGSSRLIRLTDFEENKTLHLMMPDFEWDQTALLARIRISLGGTTIAVHSKSYDPELPPGGCGYVVPSVPVSNGNVLYLFLPGLTVLALLRLERAYRRRFASGWRPITAAVTVTSFAVVIVIPYPLGRTGSGRAWAASPAAVVYFHGDHLGSSIVVTDSMATVLEQAFYRPFGGAVPASGPGFADAPEFGFTSQRYVTGANLYHFGARAYHPVLGRFLQPDPIVPDPFDPQSLNSYSYVLNNPTNLIDPTGTTPEEGGGAQRPPTPTPPFRVGPSDVLADILRDRSRIPRTPSSGNRTPTVSENPLAGFQAQTSGSSRRVPQAAIDYTRTQADAASRGEITDVQAMSLVADYLAAGGDRDQFIDQFGLLLAGATRDNIRNPGAPLVPGFGQSGFRAGYQEPQFGSRNNQVRHAAAFVVGGYQYLGAASLPNAWREITGGRTGTYPDFVLGQAGIALGTDLRLGVLPLDQVGAAIRERLGGP